MAIQTSKLTKRFGERVAVDALDIEVGEGELYALLGLNGAGKTTTILMLSCLLDPTEGDAVLLGDSVRTAPRAVKQKTNVSPQETAVAPNLTVRENLVFAARIYGFGKADAARRAEEMMAHFHLADRARDRASKLSGGCQRRLSVAMALISDPAILFLDEPTLGLDVRARRDLWHEIEALKGKVTIVLTTHYLEEVEALADRVGVMHEGRLRAVGTPAELKARTGTDTLEDAFLKLTDPEVEA